MRRTVQQAAIGGLRRGLPLATLFVLAPVSVATTSPILVNGSFELGPALDGPACPISPATCQDVDLLSGSGLLPGWTILGTSIDYLGPPWNVSNGLHAIDLDGRNATFSGVSQTFSTVPGMTYQASFDLSGNPAGGTAIKQVLVLAESFSQAYSFDTTGQSLSTLTWTPINFSFTASGPSSTLSFVSLSSTPSSHGALIDNVQVPEPSMLLPLGVGIVAAWAFRRPRT